MQSLPRLIPISTSLNQNSRPNDAAFADPALPQDRYETYEFHSAILPDDRLISIYLPSAYAAGVSNRFPVFYLHDGQNLFDGTTSYVPGSTWRAHSTADELVAAGHIEPVILVGIANTGVRRMAEYTPTRDTKMGGGEGPRYGRLIVEELKPLIDSQYRTLVSARHTAMGGSSLGGLISLYMGFRYPQVFSKLALMSPSLWWDQRSILNLPSRLKERPDLKIWLDMGSAEGERHLKDADLLYNSLLQRGWRDGVDLEYRRVAGGLHTEDAWAARFGDVLRFLFPAPSSSDHCENL